MSLKCTIYVVFKMFLNILDSIYDFTNQDDIAEDISLRRRCFELKLLSSNKLVMKHLLAVSSVGLS